VKVLYQRKNENARLFCRILINKKLSRKNHYTNPNKCVIIPFVGDGFPIPQEAKRLPYSIPTEVNAMDMENEELDNLPKESYEQRPRWQVWLARIGLVVFIGFLLMYYVNLFRGGA